MKSEDCCTLSKEIRDDVIPIKGIFKGKYLLLFWLVVRNTEE